MSSFTLTSRNKGPLRRGLIGLLLIAYTLILAEAYFRLLDPQPLMPRYVTGTAWGVRGNIPNARYWNHTPEVDVEYRINGQGLRADRDFSLSKPAGTCRVAVFGDSFFFGIELDVTQGFAGQLEKRLTDSGIHAEVLNFSVGGFGTAEMLRTFEGFGRKFQPDVVIFSWDDSDLQDNVRSGLYRLENGQLEKAGDEYLPGVKTLNWLMQYRLYRAIADHSEFYSFIREKSELLLKRQMRNLSQARASASASANASDSAVPTAQTSGGEEATVEIADSTQKRRVVDLSSEILLRAREEINSSGADFYLVEIPFKLSRTKFRSGVDVLPEAVRSQINVVYTSPALSKAARPDLELYFETGQGHLTPTGVAILVDETMKDLASSSRLAACR
jgi:hypothetical protein